MKKLSVGACALLLPLTAGCASGPKAPFDTMKSANVTAFLLQNFEPPPPPPQAQNQAPGQMIPGVTPPPEIQQWMQQGAQALQQLLGPTIQIPGATGQAAAPPPAPPDAPRFHGFRILRQTQIMDEEVREQLGEILGDEESFDNQPGACGFSEMGISFSPQPGVQNDLLLSFSCRRVIAQTFAWPHQNSGIKSETSSEFNEIIKGLWTVGGTQGAVPLAVAKGTGTETAL